MWNDCPLFRKIHETGMQDDVYLRRLEAGMWAFNSHYPQHNPKFATSCSTDRDKLCPQHVTAWKALNDMQKMRKVDAIKCIAAAAVETPPAAGTQCAEGSSNTADAQQRKERVGALKLPQSCERTPRAPDGSSSTSARARIVQPPAAPPPPVWDPDFVLGYFKRLPVDFESFTVSEPFVICQVDTCRSQRAPARSYLDGIAQHLLFKFSQVVKDKDIALLNSTTTDSVVPDGEKVAHTNCIAHTHMHLAKMAPGALLDKNALPYALDWLKNIDEQNKVRSSRTTLQML